MTEQSYQFIYQGNDPQRLDLFLSSMMDAYSRSRIQKLIKDGNVVVNSSIVLKSGFQLEKNYIVDINIPEPQKVDLVPEDIPLDIIHADDDIVVINKPAGMVVHPAVGHPTGTLIHAVLSHFPEVEGVGGVQRPGIIHRLDKDTSGLIVFAKNDKTHRWIMEQFSSRKVKKSYIALVDGRPPTPEGRIEAPIGRDTSDRKKMAVVNASKGRQSYTEYYTLKQFDAHTLLDVHLLTGRTHQIRVHMKFLGCPVVGDITYGKKRPTMDINRTFLHATHLEFFMPNENEPRVYDSSMPDELKQILENLH